MQVIEEGVGRGGTLKMKNRVCIKYECVAMYNR